MSILQENWQLGMCPEIDGIVKRTGEICLINATIATMDETGENGDHFTVELSNKVASSLSIYTGDALHKWIHFSEMYEVRDYIHDIVVGCGEASHGSRGFVAVSRCSDNRLEWFATFRNSNPFCECKLSRLFVVARSTLGVIWRFPLEEPENIRIEHDCDL